MESFDQGGAPEDEDCPEAEGAEDSPEEDLVLVALRDAEVAEDQEENEEVVHAEGFLDDVAGVELESRPRPQPQPDARPEGDRHGDPDGGPAEGLLQGDLVRPAVEDEEIH